MGLLLYLSLVLFWGLVDAGCLCFVLCWWFGCVGVWVYCCFSYVFGFVGFVFICGCDCELVAVDVLIALMFWLIYIGFVVSACCLFWLVL